MITGKKRIKILPESYNPNVLKAPEMHTFENNKGDNLYSITCAHYHFLGDTLFLKYHIHNKRTVAVVGALIELFAMANNQKKSVTKYTFPLKIPPNMNQDGDFQLEIPSTLFPSFRGTYFVFKYLLEFQLKYEFSLINVFSSSKTEIPLMLFRKADSLLLKKITSN
jgi:hypothetical protein